MCFCVQTDNKDLHISCVKPDVFRMEIMWVEGRLYILYSFTHFLIWCLPSWNSSTIRPHRFSPVLHITEDPRFSGTAFAPYLSSRTLSNSQASLCIKCYLVSYFHILVVLERICTHLLPYWYSSYKLIATCISFQFGWLFCWISFSLEWICLPNPVSLSLSIKKSLRISWDAHQ